MKVIALYGHANCGKTETLTKLINLIIKANPNGIKTSNVNGADSQFILSYQNKTICICTAGDYPDNIEANFNFAIAEQADILVTASRSRGATCDKVIEMAGKCAAPIEWYKKSDEINLSDRLKEECNQGYAEYLLGKL